MEAPRANPENLLSLVQAARQGKVVIPEFQRSFVWSRDEVEELLLSILQGYFIGTFLVLDASVTQRSFPFRLVEGLQTVDPSINVNQLPYPSVRLVLDGQQRLTSLFYALYEPQTTLKSSKKPYRFYLRIDEALAGNFEDAIEGVSQSDRRTLAEINEAIREHRAISIPTLVESSKFYAWLYSEQTYLQSEQEKRQVEQFHLAFKNFVIPVVSLPIDTREDNVVNIFERINRFGVSLSLFDLAVARLYVKGIKLRVLWDEFRKSNPDVAKVIRPEFPLKVINLMRKRESKAAVILRELDSLDSRNFPGYWEKATAYLVKAYQRVTATNSYGAFQSAWIPYTTILTPLAAILARCDDLRGGEAGLRKIDRWYWTSVLSQRYDNAVDSNSYRDYEAISNWMEGQASAPTWLSNTRLEQINLDVDEARSALYRGLMCILAKTGAKDFLTGQPPNLHECQDDHIFPRATYGSNELVDSILNRTLISATTNRIKSDRRPAEFLHDCLSSHGDDERRVIETLRTHIIPELGYEALKRNDFNQFIETRRLALSSAVQTLLEL